MMIPSPTLTGAIHAALVMFCIVVGLIQLLRPKRGASGCLATREQIWTATSVTTASVTAVGYVLINRYRPTAESQPSPGQSLAAS